jgi:hypothetical protein
MLGSVLDVVLGATPIAAAVGPYRPLTIRVSGLPDEPYLFDMVQAVSLFRSSKETKEVDCNVRDA